MEKKVIFSLRKYRKQLCAIALVTTTLAFTQGVSADEIKVTQPHELQITADMTEYRLRAGDTLWAISEKIGISLQELADYNNVNLARGEEKRLPVGFLVKWQKGKSALLKHEVNSQMPVDSPLEWMFLENKIQSVEFRYGLTHVRLKDDVAHDVFENLVNGVREVTSSVENKIEKDSILIETLTQNNEVDKSKASEVLKPEIPSVSESKADKEEISENDDHKSETLEEKPEKPSVPKETENLADKIYFLQRFRESSDMILVESNGRFGLVDVGYLNKDTADYAIKFMKDKGIKELDFIYLTHYDGDHWMFLNTHNRTGERISEKYDGTFGRTDLFDNFKINQVYLPKPDNRVPVEQPFHDEIIKTLNDYKISFSYGKNFEMGDFVFTTYNDKPLNDQELAQSDHDLLANYNSRALLVEKENYDVLLNGDIEKYDEPDEAREVLLDSGTVDVLKAGHHGYSSSNTKEFLEAIQPKAIVVTNSSSYVSSVDDQRMKEYSSQGVYYTGSTTIELDMTNLDQGITVGNGQKVYTTIVNDSMEGTRLDREATLSSSGTAPVAGEEVLMDGAN